MLESGLWTDEMIPQAQGVAYLHGTKEKPVYEHGGEYVYYQTDQVNSSVMMSHHHQSQDKILHFF